MATVAFRGLEKAFGTQSVLSGIDLDIGDGEFVVIVGPSGCGKSTLLRILAGLDAPDAGTLTIDNQDALPLSPAQRGVAMVFQSYALYPHLNVFENMAFGLRMAKRGEAEIRTAVDRAAKMLGIEALLQRRPKELSGGQRQRVAIGRAIVRQPRLFLLDEPLSNLDASLRVHMRHEFARLHRELATTTVYVTHDQVEAMTLASRIVVLNNGRIEQIGTPAEIYAAPRNLFVAGFLGSPRMNLLDGKVTKVGKGGVTVALHSGDTVTVATDAVSTTVGDAVTVGIRPEALARATPAARGNILSVTVDVVESLGHTHGVYGLLSGVEAPVCALLPGALNLPAGDTLRLHFAPEDAYLFDAAGNAFTRLPVRAVAS